VSAPAKPTAPRPISVNNELMPFDSGVPALDEWLKRRALQNEAAGASRTFVLCEGQRVIGYYCLAAASVMHDIATSKVRRNMPDPIPAVVIGRLALDKSCQGKGLGADLLRDAVLRIAGAAGTVGVRAVLVHAISDDAKRFYQRFGFRASPVEAMTLMMTEEEVGRIIE
jgi:GNAT superfamily N-acetyltransferase